MNTSLDERSTRDTVIFGIYSLLRYTGLKLLLFAKLKFGVKKMVQMAKNYYTNIFYYSMGYAEILHRLEINIDRGDSRGLYIFRTHVVLCVFHRMDK